MAEPTLASLTTILEPSKVALVMPLVGLVKTRFAPALAQVPPSFETCCWGAPPFSTMLKVLVCDQLPPSVITTRSAVILIFVEPLWTTKGSVWPFTVWRCQVPAMEAFCGLGAVESLPQATAETRVSIRKHRRIVVAPL